MPHLELDIPLTFNLPQANLPSGWYKVLQENLFKLNQPFVHALVFDAILDPGDSIQDAVDDLPATGGIIFLSPGTHTLSSMLTISKSNVKIFGAGTTTILSIATALGITISGINTELRDVRINLSGAQAITVSGSVTGVKLRNIFFDNISGANITFVGIAASSNCIIEGCTATVTAGGITRAFTLSGIENAVLNSRVEGCLLGILIGSSSVNVIVSNCVLISNTTGIEITGPHATVSSCSMRFVTGGVTGIGIEISSGDFAVIQACNIDGNGNTGGSSAGITITGAVLNSSISNCIIRDLATVGISDSGGTAADVSINGCTIENITVGDGINIAGSSRYNISSNTLRTIAGDGIQLAGTDSCSIVGNILSAVTGTEILETGGADFNHIAINHATGGTITIVGADTVSTANFV